MCNIGSLICSEPVADNHARSSRPDLARSRGSVGPDVLGGPRSALSGYVGGLLGSTSEGSTSSDESDLTSKTTVLPIPSRNRTPPRKPSPVPAPQAPQASNSNQQRPSPRSLLSKGIVELNDGQITPEYVAKMGSPGPSTAKPSRGAQSVTAQCPTHCWHSDASTFSSNVSSPSTVISDPHGHRSLSLIEMLLPVGFEHASIKQIFESIEALIQKSENPADHDSHPLADIFTSMNAGGPPLRNLTLPQTPLAMRLPGEIIIQIYNALHPIDANAARHTCRSWMNASLNKHFLKIMLQRGGWWNAFRRFAKSRRSSAGTTPRSRLEPLWLMSCFLSRECALSGHWTGNGVINIKASALPTCDHHWGHCPKPSCCASRQSVILVDPLREVAHVTFDELACGRNPLLKANAFTFTASSCGNYVLVAEGGVIYAYRLSSTCIDRITSILCPRRVLAMSMDVSSRRLAISVLLEGRMGLLCNTPIDGSTNRQPSPESAEHQPGPNSEHFKVRTSTVRTACRWAPLTSDQAGTGVGRLDLDSGRNTEVFQIRSDEDVETFVDDHTERGRTAAHINQAWNSHATHGETIPGRHCIYYHQICSDDDPPRSVAMCPKRSCVAFGCTGGIELHWIDALTGQDLTRWFPLAGPADHLYFLPARRGIDTPSRLRLISSVAHPSQRRRIALKFTSSSKTHSNSGITNSFWGTIGFESAMPTMAGIVSDHDHYRAVPINDGIHMLFVDPDSGLLILGTDTPANDARRLIRKIMLLPPTEGAEPLIYASTLKSTGGPKIVVGYGDQIVLYSVPSDVFDLSRKGQSPCGLSEDDIQRATKWMSWWPKNDIPANHPCSSTAPYMDIPRPRAVCPLSIRGVTVGRLHSLTEMAINTSSGRISIWAFASNGDASVWQLDDGTPITALTQRNIGRDGRVMAPYKVEADGDVVMESDTSPISVSVHSGGSGNSTLTPSASGSYNSVEQELWDSSWDATPGEGEDDEIFMMDAV